MFTFAMFAGALASFVQGALASQHGLPLYIPTSLRVQHLLEHDALGIDSTNPILGW